MNLAIFFVSALLSGTPSAAEGNGSGVRTTPAPAATTGQAPATAGNQPQPEERRICRRVESETGSRTSSAQRVCMTAREWRVYDRQEEAE